MSNRLVLVACDNDTTRKLMRVVLQAEGYRVAEASNGATALVMAREQSPALALVDCKLSDMSGFELGRQLRALTPDLPLLAIAGWAQADEARALSAGFLGVLSKPVDAARLVELVERHFGQAQRSAHAGKTVLLVDDDPTQRKLAELVLSSAGFEVLQAENGEAALALALSSAPALIVADVLMPKMDGFALCRAVRRAPSLATIPVVLMSAHYLEAEDRALGASFGATRYVTRSSGFATVLRAVHEALDAPASEPKSLPADDPQTEYLSRIAHQLERQASIGVGLAQRVSLQASALLVLDDLADSLARQRDPESALSETLCKCLDAAGLTVGAILLCDARGQLMLKAHIGTRNEVIWANHDAVFQRAIGANGMIIPSAEAGTGGQALLEVIGAASTVLVPIVGRDELLGVLLLASSDADLAGAEGGAAVRAARSVSTQLGQALALSRLFSKLSSAEERYRSLLEHAYDAISICSPEGVVLEVNGRMEELAGRPREEILGRHIRDLAPDSGEQSHEARFEQAVARGHGTTPLVSIARPDGSVVLVEFSSTVVAVGSERYVLNIGRDVSARLKLEEQLRQSQKMEAVGRLAGGIAHDFNNVLSVILSYGELMLGELKAGEPMRDDVQEIRKAANRAADLTRQLLMFSRQQVLESKVVDLNEVLQNIDKMLQRILGADIDLVSLSSRGLGRVRIDPGNMDQVIMNLVVNARDAMPHGGKLTMETANVFFDEEYARSHHGVVPGPYVMLAVTDTGTGMDRATQARIFEPFYTTKEAGKGTGLGLATVFGIVHQSGGTIWVYSEVGKGTAFKVYLPSVEAALDALQPPPVLLDLHGTETLLLVEDDDQVRLVAQGILRKNGYRVLEARNAGEALLHSERHEGPIHLLLTDVVMPGMSGPELAARLALLRPDMKLLCMSGYTDDSILRHGVLAPNIAYVQKPLTPSLLTHKVREVLGNARAAFTPA